MDYKQRNRRELQALCKEHGISANKTNAYMAKALGALLDTPKENESKSDSTPNQREVSVSPLSEFKPVPESFAEIMTPGRALLEATNGCQHRLGRKSGKSCISCTYEKKTSSLMQDVLQITPSRRALGGGEFQNGTTRIPFQKLCHGLRHLKAETSGDLDFGTVKDQQVKRIYE